jgi:hypothetical protein
MTATRQQRYIGRLKTRLVVKLCGRCKVCGCELSLEFAHLRPTGLNGRGRGMKARLLNIQKHLEDYVLMCHSCHREYDRLTKV